MTGSAAQEGAAPLPPPNLGPAIWLWPAASALLAAWPVWRSLFPETPDLGQGWLRLQVLAGMGGAVLFAVWTARQRRRIPELAFPLWATLLAVASAIVALSRDDQAGADLCALMIGWMATGAIFAALVLLQIQATGIAAGCKAPQRVGLLPPLPRLGAAMGLAMAAITVLAVLLPANAAIMGVISPGAILAWAALSDTARSVLSKRQVQFADAGALLALTRRRRWRLLAPTILLSDRVKLVSIHPAAGVKPGELVGLAAALTMEEESDIGRAIQEFGVSHRIRLPALRRPKDPAETRPRHATLADGAEIGLHDIAALEVERTDLSPFGETIELARLQHRPALALVEGAPRPRVLGLIVFGMAARSGAAEALRVLRDRAIDVELNAAPRDAADALALKALRVERAVASKDAARECAAILRPGQGGADAGAGLMVSFGAARTRSASATDIVIASEDARSLVDIARFADDFRARTKVVTLLASAPGWVLIAAAFGHVPSSPFLVTGVALIGVAIAAVTPQVLRLSPALDKEGSED